MKVLIVGGGGREHAIAEAVKRSQKTDKIYCAPGNAGIESIAECVDIKVMEFDRLVRFAKKHALLNKRFLKYLTNVNRARRVSALLRSILISTSARTLKRRATAKRLLLLTAL